MSKVIWHDHVFPSDRSWESDDETGRYDVIEQEDGLITVINPFVQGKDRLQRVCTSRTEALIYAQQLADGLVDPA